MARILAIDYGVKRTGIAVTDELQLIASGLTTVATDTLLPFLKEYVTKEKVSLIVVGKPTQMTGEDSESEVYIRSFLTHLKKEIPTVPFERVDERFTSKMAVQTMIDGGLKKKKRRDKALVDQISATIILQSYIHNR